MSETVHQRKLRLDALAYRLKSEGRTYKQVAAEMGVSVTMIRNRIAAHKRVLSRIRWSQRLAEQDPSPSPLSFEPQGRMG